MNGRGVINRLNVLRKTFLVLVRFILADIIPDTYAYCIYYRIRLKSFCNKLIKVSVDETNYKRYGY